MSVVYVEVTEAQREAFDMLAERRGMTLRELVISSVLGSETPRPLLTRLLDLEARVIVLEGKVA